MREHFHRTPPPKLSLGIPQPPPHMVMNAELLAVPSALVYSVRHEGKGQIRVLVSSGTCTYERLGDPDRKPGQLAQIRHLGDEVGGVSFWLTAMTAREFLLGMRSRIAGEFPVVDAKPVPASGDAWRDIGQLASFELAHLGEADTQHLFSRAVDDPYSVRLDFDRAGAARFVVLLQAALDAMTNTEQELSVEALNVSVEVGKKREEESVASRVPSPSVDAVSPPALPAADAPAALPTWLTKAKQLAHKVIDRIGG